jgi:hypothetical protein
LTNSVTNSPTGWPVSPHRQGLYVTPFFNGVSSWVPKPNPRRTKLCLCAQLRAST